MKHIDRAIVLSFDHVGSGLIAKGGTLKGFTICGNDQTFIPATATINGNKVIVRHEKIIEPLHVRYAWSDNPHDANLYNVEGLPASPFTTESN
ncbi:hypothetical protein [Bacillus sp. JCM 19034]|uniref:hypothetical protein n=1 Tax=Bacillus sp. JCM 19034 TaxID=1481928 RepID=UPI00078166E4|nr:hypothetical protein [Bacillus sp. JCM 19034]